MGRVNQPPTVGGTENHEKPGARENEPTPDGKKDKSQNERRKCESQDMTHVHTHTGSVGHFGEYETTDDGWVYHQGTWETPRSFWEAHQKFREKPGCAGESFGNETTGAESEIVSSRVVCEAQSLVSTTSPSLNGSQFPGERVVLAAMDACPKLRAMRAEMPTSGPWDAEEFQSAPKGQDR